MKQAELRSWGVLAVKTVLAGRGDLATSDLRRALDAGWEPFAVADGHIWLRKQTEREGRIDE
jgi:hypothetical protein